MTKNYCDKKIGDFKNSWVPLVVIEAEWVWLAWANGRSIGMELDTWVGVRSAWAGTTWHRSMEEGMSRQYKRIRKRRFFRRNKLLQPVGWMRYFCVICGHTTIMFWKPAAIETRRELLHVVFQRVFITYVRKKNPGAASFYLAGEDLLWGGFLGT